MAVDEIVRPLDEEFSEAIIGFGICTLASIALGVTIVGGVIYNSSNPIFGYAVVGAATIMTIIKCSKQPNDTKIKTPEISSNPQKQL
jgi:hypothetical protein